jgi:uncharacterized membrane protein required for colicin V production
VPNIPNWVDIIVLSIVLRACYNGLNRGLITELVNLAGALGVTAFTINYAGVATTWLTPWLLMPPAATRVVVFWGVFAGAWFGVRWVRRRIGQIIKWERFHWLIQGCGLLVGAIRGLWWAGFVLLAIVSTGYPGLQSSVEARSAAGPRLLRLFRASLDEVTNRFPGAGQRTGPLIPPVKPIMTP